MDQLAYLNKSVLTFRESTNHLQRYISQVPDVPIASANVQLRNISDHSALTFKILTTNVDRYIVHPNIGVLKPGEEIILEFARDLRYNISTTTTTTTTTTIHKQQQQQQDVFLIKCAPLLYDNDNHSECYDKQSLSKFWCLMDKYKDSNTYKADIQKLTLPVDLTHLHLQHPNFKINSVPEQNRDYTKKKKTYGKKVKKVFKKILSSNQQANQTIDTLSISNVTESGDDDVLLERLCIDDDDDDNDHDNNIDTQLHLQHNKTFIQCQLCSNELLKTDAVSLPCYHVYHRQCLHKIRNKNPRFIDECPTCHSKEKWPWER